MADGGVVAHQGPFALALAAVVERQRDAWGRASAGYVGASDGWQDFARNGAMTWEYASAGPGNVALLGELPRSSVLSLAFGSSVESAATLALSALFEPFESTRTDTSRSGLNGMPDRKCRRISTRPACELYRAVSDLCNGAARPSGQHLPGAMVASLSVPGRHQGGARGLSLGVAADLVECGGALLAIVRNARPAIP